MNVWIHSPILSPIIVHNEATFMEHTLHSGRGNQREAKNIFSYLWVSLVAANVSP